VDVLIIGAGASGAAVAWSLAETKMHILCLEQGDWMNPANYPSAGLPSGNSAHRADLPRQRLPASCCNATTATIVSCVRSGWSFARHFRKGTRWSRVTGRYWIL